MNIDANANYFNGIPKFIINVQDRPDRLNHTIQQLDKINISNFITRVNANKPDSILEKNLHHYISEEAYKNIINVNSTKLLPNLKSVAVTNSHKEIWKYILNNNLNNALVMEDDIEITDSFLFMKELTYLSDLINNVPDNVPLYVIFNGLYDINKECSQYFDEYLNSHHIYVDDTNTVINYSSYNHQLYPNFKYFPKNSTDVVGCHFYYINYEMAKILLNNLKVTSYQIDIEISMLSKNSSLIDKCTFLNVETKSIIQSKKFESSVQLYRINSIELKNLLKLPSEIINHMLVYLPSCLKN